VRSGRLSSAHSVLPGEGTRSSESESTAHWTRSTAPTTLAETGNGTRPEHDGPEQGRGREGLGRLAKSLSISIEVRPVISSSRLADAPCFSPYERTRWLHPAQAGRDASSPWIESSIAAPITNRTCCLDNKNLITPRSPGEGTG
jgi:hypothetical protein